jgi:flagellar hook-associated protein 1 FlgK
VGSDLSAAEGSQSTKQALLSQAQALRQQTSGVSLDEQAQYLIEFQRSSQAVAKTLSVLNTWMDSLMNLFP